MMQITNTFEIYKIALSFLDDHHAASSSVTDQYDLVKRCIERIFHPYKEHLTMTYARDVTLQALCEIKSRECNINATIHPSYLSSHAFFIRSSGSKKEWIVPLANLMPYVPRIDLISEFERGGERLPGYEPFFG